MFRTGPQQANVNYKYVQILWLCKCILSELLHFYIFQITLMICRNMLLVVMCQAVY